jgi:hypothetical protein
MQAGIQESPFEIQQPESSIQERPFGVEKSAPGAEKAVFRAAGRFIRRRWLLILAISVTVLLPCFWHKHIEAGDLGSHVYNAWLTELVQKGQLSGLTIAHQWNNVAFDLLLSGFGKIVGWVWAEKLAVSLCVLTFFWGAFFLIAAAAGRAPLFLTPLIAIVSYGWTFQQGFINYYLSLGLSFFALAILWRGNRKERLVVVLLVPLIFMAHPLGLVWLAGAGGYAIAAERLPQHRFVLFALATLLAVSTSLYVQRHFFVHPSTKPPYVYNGADQVVLYSRGYKLIAFAMVSFVLFALGNEVWRRRTDAEIRGTGAILFQLYLMLQSLLFVLPEGVLVPGYKAPVTYLPHRLTTLSAVIICGLLALMKARKWHLFVYSTVAALFFSLLYRDTGIINDMEEQSERLIATLPFGQRVLFTITDGGLRLNIGHFVDRSCINHCFSYGNYEPSTGQFRLRAMPDNGKVMTQVPDVWQMEVGNYHVRSEDLPAYEIYQCGEKGRQVCLRSLKAGEKNNPPVAIQGSPFDVR